MLPTLTAWGFTLDLGLVLLLAYLLALWVGGWALEFLARAHFRRARRYAHAGFAYDVELDRYECPQGELLTLHTFDDRYKLTIYKAPAATCNACVLKAFCTPHDQGRHVYHSLAEFHETDVGRFHRWLSLIILGMALVFSVGGLLAWWNKPGEWLLVITFMKPRPLAVRPEELRAIRRAFCRAQPVLAEDGLERLRWAIEGRHSESKVCGESALLCSSPPTGATRRKRPPRGGLPHTTSFGRGW